MGDLNCKSEKKCTHTQKKSFGCPPVFPIVLFCNVWTFTYSIKKIQQKKVLKICTMYSKRLFYELNCSRKTQRAKQPVQMISEYQECLAGRMLNDSCGFELWFQEKIDTLLGDATLSRTVILPAISLKPLSATCWAVYVRLVGDIYSIHQRLSNHNGNTCDNDFYLAANGGFIYLAKVNSARADAGS